VWGRGEWGEGRGERREERGEGSGEGRGERVAYDRDDGEKRREMNK
jgi:hypothetical protein